MSSLILSVLNAISDTPAHHVLACFEVETKNQSLQVNHTSKIPWKDTQSVTLVFTNGTRRTIPAPTHPRNHAPASHI